MGSRRLSFSLILGIVATPIIAAPATDNIQKRSEGNVKESIIENIPSQKYYSPLADFSPSPWDLNVPDGLGEMDHVFYLRRPRQVDFEDSTEDLETAEQILFRPLFRHRQMVAERVQRLREKEALRRRLLTAESFPQFLSNSINVPDDRFFSGRQRRSTRSLSSARFDNPEYYFNQ